MRPSSCAVLLFILFSLGTTFSRAQNPVEGGDEKGHQLQLIHEGIERTRQLLAAGCSFEFTATSEKETETYQVTQQKEGYRFQLHFQKADKRFDQSTTFDGTKYMGSNPDGPEEITLTSDFQRSLSFDTGNFLGENPLLVMEGFLTPCQGFVSYADLSRSGQWDLFVKSIRKVSLDSAKNIVVETLGPETYRQVVTFSAEHHYYPVEIRSSLDDRIAWVTTVKEWLPKGAAGGADVPLRIESGEWTEGKMTKKLQTLEIVPSSFKGLPGDAQRSFFLPITADTYVHDRDLKTWEDGQPVIAPWPAGTRREASFDLKFKDMEGHEHSLADYKGKTIVLNFWATWCGACMAEFPSLVHLANKLKPDDHAVVLCVSSEDLATIGKVREVDGLKAPIYSISSKEIPDAYRIVKKHLPVTFIIDPAGKIVLEQVGTTEWTTHSVVAFIRTLKAP